MRFISQDNARKKKGERGVMLAVAALSFTSFLLAAGMAVDVSNFYTAGTELQNAADAAALAGASVLKSTAASVDAAVIRATSVANTYQFNVADVSIPTGNVTFAANLNQFDSGGNGWDATTAKQSANVAKVRFVKVKIAPTTVKVYLASVALGRGSATFNRTSVAGQSASGSTAPGTGGDPGLTSVTNPSRIILVEDDTGSGTLSVVGTCGNNTVYTKGCTYNVNMTPPCDALSATYEIADGSVGSAGADRNKQIIGGLDGCYCKDSEVPVWTHPQAVNIRNALNTTLNHYSNSGIPKTAAGEYPPDSNVATNGNNGISYNDYKNGVGAAGPTAGSNGVATGVPGRRILVMGIMKKSSWWIDPADTTYEIATMEMSRYGAFFLRKRPTSSGQLQLEYIGDRLTVPSGNNCAACPVGTLTNGQSSDTTSGIAVPVLYR